MSQKPVGVFDSGIGGLTCVRALISAMPGENIVYFGDTGRVPYGTRSKDTIIKYARQDATFLLSKNVKMIIAACGTVSSVATGLGNTLGVPYTGVVEPTSLAAVNATKNGRIGVIGTSATIRSGSYRNEIARLNPSVTVYEQECPLFVPLVENGFTDKNDEIVKLTVDRYLKGFKSTGVDTLILGCTHYPILNHALSDYFGEDVTLIDSGSETAKYASLLLESLGLRNVSGHTVQREYYVSDSPDSFSSAAGIYLGERHSPDVTRIDIEKY